METHKNHMLESVSGKKVIFFSPHLAIPTYHTRSLHIYCLPISGSSFCLVHLPSACMLPMNSVATTTMSKNLTAPSISTSHQPPAMRTRGKPSSGGAVLHARRRHIVSLGRCTAIQECMYRARERAEGT